MTKVIHAIRSGHPGSLFSAFLYFDVSFMIWILLGPLAVYIADDFALSPAEKGFLVAVPILSGAILRLIMGALTDHIGPKKTGMIGLCLTLIPLVWGWKFAAGVHDLIAIGLLLGVAGASFAVSLPLASRWYPAEHQGLAMGIAGAGNSGTVITALVAPRLAEHLGWRAVFGIGMIPVILTLAVFWLMAKDSPNQPRPKSWLDYLKVLRQRDSWWFNFFYCISFGGFVGLTSYLVIFFHDAYGLNRMTAGNLTALCVFSGSFFRPVGGYLADRFEGVRVLSFLFPATGLAMLGVGLNPPVAGAVALLFFGMMTLGMANGCIFQIVPRRFREEIGVITGVVGAFGGLGGFFLPTMLGFLKQLTGSAHAGFAVYGILPLAACALLQSVYRFSWKKSWMARPAPVAPDFGGRVRMEVVFGG